MSDENPRTVWWKSLPDILKTVAAVVGGVTALVVALNQTGIFGSGGDQPASPPMPAIPSGSGAEARSEISADEFCSKLSGQTIYFLANKYPGILGPSGLELREDADGTFAFSSNMLFSPDTSREFTSNAFPAEVDDPVSGTCEASFLRFTRRLRDGSHQTYFGSMARSPDGMLTISGTFRDAEEEEKEWTGRVAPEPP